MLQRKTPLARGPGPKRKIGLCAQSRAARRQKAELAKVYAALDAGRDRYCVACGSPHNLDHSHILAQGNYRQHRTNPLNILDLCRQHHELYENNKQLFAREYPEVYAESLSRMEQIDPLAYQLFLLKNPEPAPTPSIKEAGGPPFFTSNS